MFLDIRTEGWRLKCCLRSSIVAVAILGKDALFLLKFYFTACYDFSAEVMALTT